MLFKFVIEIVLDCYDSFSLFFISVKMFYFVFGRLKMFYFCVIVVVFKLLCRALRSSCCLICSCQVV